MGRDQGPTRRDFLRGRAAVDALLDLTQGEPSSGGAASESAAAAGKGSAAAGSTVDAGKSAGSEGLSEARYLVRVARQAMACEFAIAFNAGQYADDTAAAIEALDLVERLEEQLSVYRETSELSEVNRRAAEGPVEVEEGLLELLELGMRVHGETNGALDLTAGPLSRAWGFFRRAGQVPSDDELAAALALVGSDQVRLDRDARTVAFDRAGIELNVNSLGKGYALDRAAEQLAAAGIDDFLMHGGRSSVLARGSHAGSSAGGWRVGLRHPLRPERRLAEFFLHDRALATSGSAAQSFHHQGRRYGHVLDPRSGMPAAGVHSATVVAESAALADALSTAFYVLGAEGAREYCAAHAGVGCVIVTPGAKEGSVDVSAAGLEPSEWRLLEGAS